MPVFNDADDIKLGGSQVDKVYLGGTEVWAPAPTGSNYDTEVLADSPWAYWRLEETSGSTLADETGNGRSATNVGGDLTVTGQQGSAIGLDGINDYFHNSMAVFNGAHNTGLTIELWVRSTDTSQSRIMGCYNNSDDQGMQLMINAESLGAYEAGAIWVQFRTEGGSSQHTGHVSNTGLFDGNWHHLVLTNDFTTNSDSVRVYVDGVEKTFTYYTNGTGTYGTWEYNFTFGARNVRGSLDSYFDGDLDEVAVYDSVLTPTRVTAHYNA